MSLRRQALVSAPATTRDAEKAGRDEALATLLAISTDDSRIFSSKVVCGSPRLGKDHRFLDRQPTDDLIELQRTLGVKMSEYMRKSAYDKPPNNR